ncbi:hypothetical protein AB1Y20_006899 [Prymnesium parvum]|uniref:JmjC domain-containing protein n=1 Tax=Prymnesium parvum TaxID=97485 RepID=A0AB34IYW4_PRYPA
MEWRPCPLAHSTAGLLEAAMPAVLQGLVPPPHSFLAAALAGNETVRVDVTPSREAPLKLRRNATLVKPAHRLLPLQHALALLRSRRRAYEAYVRHLELRTPRTAALRAELPLRAVFDLAGAQVEAANLWLGDGGVSSPLHYDGLDNLLVQLAGEKRVRLLPPEAFPQLGYRPYHEHQFVFDEKLQAFAGHEPSGHGAMVENHADVDVLSDVRGEAAGGECVRAEAAVSAQGLECVLREGQTLFLPALWSHAVLSSPHPASSSPAAGLNVAVNVWFIRGTHSFSRALAAQPAWSEAHFCHAEALHKTGRLAEAAAAYERSLALRPAYFDAQHNLASLRLAAADAAAAADAFGRACALRPADSRCLVNWGIALARGGRLGEAAAAHAAAIALAPDEPRAWKALGNARAREGRLGEAADALRAALRLAPADASVYNSLGVALDEAGRGAEAVAALRAAVELDPASDKARANLEMAVARGVEGEGASKLASSKLAHHVGPPAANGKVE